MNNDSKTYEENFKLLKNIADELSKGDMSIDEVMKKGETAGAAAKKCIEILKEHKGSFTKLEQDLAKLVAEVEDIIEDGEG
jgi:exodeoxyribonuclease VII small subunit